MSTYPTDRPNPMTGESRPSGFAETQPPGSSVTQPAKDDLVQRVAQGAHQTIDSLAERAGPQVHRLQEGLHETEQMVRQRAEQAKEMAGEWTENLRGTVRQHPLTSLAAALAAGVLLARLTR
jgi:ElaB/YqjD/DUF883 family membrane-anchored ribosome-binding protein